MKKALFFLLAMTLVLTSTGCSNGTGASSASGGTSGASPATSSTQASGSTDGGVYVPSDEPVTLRWCTWGGTARHEQRQGWMKAFMEEYPNFTIEYEAETEDSLVEKILIQTQAGEAPDIYHNSSYHLQDFKEKGLLRILDPWVESAALSTEGYETLREIGQVDGEQVQWPTQAATMNGIYYNATKIAELGMEMPKNGWYWDEYEAFLREGAAKIKEKGWTGVWISEDEGGLYRSFEGWLVSKGKSMFSSNGLNFDKEDLAEWLTMWEGYRKEGMVPPGDITSEYSGKSWEESMIVAGKVLMNNQSYTHLVAMDKAMDDTMALVTPAWAVGGEEATPVISAGYCISSITKKADKAVFFMNWLNQSEVVQRSCFDFYGSCTNTVWNEKFGQMIESGEIATVPGLIETVDYSGYLTPFSIAYPPMPSGATSCQDLLTAANEMVAFSMMSIDEAVEDFFQQSSQVFARN